MAYRALCHSSESSMRLLSRACSAQRVGPSSSGWTFSTAGLQQGFSALLPTRHRGSFSLSADGWVSVMVMLLLSFPGTRFSGAVITVLMCGGRWWGGPLSVGMGTHAYDVIQRNTKARGEANPTPAITDLSIS